MNNDVTATALAHIARSWVTVRSGGPADCHCALIVDVSREVAPACAGVRDVEADAREAKVACAAGEDCGRIALATLAIWADLLYDSVAVSAPPW
jgi:hypothetical protein